MGGENSRVALIPSMLCLTGVASTFPALRLGATLRRAHQVRTGVVVVVVVDLKVDT